MIRLAGKASCLNAHIVMELEELLVSPQVAQAKGGTDSGGLVVILDDGEDLANVAGADDNLATERNVGKGWLDVAHEVAE